MIDFYKVLGCTPDTLTDDDIETLKMFEKMKLYPPCFRLLFSPDGPQNGDTQVKLSLHGLNNASPIMIRLGKEMSGIYITAFFLVKWILNVHEENENYFNTM